MTYYNNGSFETNTSEEMRELIKIINEIGLGTVTCDEDDIYHLDNKFCLELSDCIGDIEVSLSDIVTACKKGKLDINFYITYCGDAEGAYSYQNGEFETLDENDLLLRNISDEQLISEIYRRGLTQKICEDSVRDFMNAELREKYGFSESAAQKAALLAFDHYINTEGATQYDGIEWAAEQMKNM